MRANNPLLIIGSMALFISTSYSAAGKDLELLTSYLVPLFLAQNFAVTCRAKIPDFLGELPAGVDSVNVASATIKAEITDGLPANEAAGIVLVAANTARREAVGEMRALSSDGQTIPRQVLYRWCHEKVEPYILNMLRSDQQDHDNFVAVLERAKR